MKGVRMLLLMATGVMVIWVDSTATNAGEIQINMYSLLANGVRLRADTQIKVSAFFTQSSTDDEPLAIGARRLDIRAKGADKGGNVNSGVAIFSIPDSFYPQETSNIPISFAFEIDNIRVQAVLGAVVPKQGRVELHVVVPDPTPRQNCRCPSPPPRCCGSHWDRCCCGW